MIFSYYRINPKARIVPMFAGFFSNFVGWQFAFGFAGFLFAVPESSRFFARNHR